jgi:hypothetical protein
MALAQVDHEARREGSDPAELLIKEARQKARRRRLTVGGILLTVLVVVAAVLVAVGRGPTSSTRTTGNGSGGATGTSRASVYVANLAGSNTFAATGSHVWVTISYANFKTHPTTLRYGLVELNANNGTLVRVIKDRAGDLLSPQYVAQSGSHLWVTTNNSVSEFNVTKGSLVRVINAKADRFADPGAIVVSGGHVWVANGEEGTNSVTELKTSNGSLVRVINAKADQFRTPAAFAVSGTHLWVLNARGDSITELNARDGSLVRVINARAGASAGPNFPSGPVTLTASGPHLWVGDLHDYPNGSTSLGSVAEFNVGSGTLVRIIKAPVDRLDLPGGIVVTGGHVWVLNEGNDYVGDSITELNASNGSLVRVINAKSVGFHSANGLAVSDSHVVVLNIYSGAQGSITELNASNGSLVRIIK